MNRFSRRSLASLIVSFAGLTASPFASAADKYAVMSLVSDELTIVTYQPSVGTQLDSNLRQVVPLNDDSFNEVASRSAAAAIHRIRPDAVTVVLPAVDRSVYANEIDMGTPSEALTGLLASVRSAVTDPDVNYVVLITKTHGETRMKFRESQLGQGKLAGLGFYFDKNLRTVRTNTGAEGRGFLSPYAYLSVSLIDLRTGSVVRTHAGGETQAISSGISGTETHPWDAVPTEMKVRTLNGVIRKLVSTSVPQVIEPT